MEVVHFHRFPLPGYFSLERLFEDVRRAMPVKVECRSHVARFPSLGLWRRIYNILEAPFYQGEVNHVTGDVHYLDFFLRKQRTLLTIPDCASLERLRGLRREALRFFWYTLPVWRAGLVSVISTATKAELLRYVRCNPDKIRVVPCCVSGDFGADARPFNATRPKLLHVGTGKNKNLVRVAEALAEIPCSLHIIGRLDDEQKAALQRWEIDYSSSEGLTNDRIVAAYQECDLVIFASTYEGFGLPIVEANATGRPVVTSSLLSMPEVAGDAACLVNPLDVASIRAGVLKIIEDEEYRETLVRNGFVNARRFSAEAVARQYAALYEELLAGRRAGPT